MENDELKENKELVLFLGQIITIQPLVDMKNTPLNQWYVDF